MIRRLILVLALLPALFVRADSLQTLLDTLQAVPSVMPTSVRNSTPRTFHGEVYQCTVTWIEIVGPYAKKATRDCWIYKLGVVGEETAYWQEGLPGPLQAAVRYFSARTISNITAAQIETYCNAKWLGLNAGSANIREFTVTPVDGSTVKITGNFNIVGSGTWEQRSYYIRLIDPDGSVTTGSTNIVFERITSI